MNTATITPLLPEVQSSSRQPHRYIYRTYKIRKLLSQHGARCDYYSCKQLVTMVHLWSTLSAAVSFEISTRYNVTQELPLIHVGYTPSWVSQIMPGSWALTTLGATEVRGVPYSYILQHSTHKVNTRIRNGARRAPGRALRRRAAVPGPRFEHTSKVSTYHNMYLWIPGHLPAQQPG